MSVYILSPAEYGAIAATLRVARDGFREPLFPLSMAEKYAYRVLVEPLKHQAQDDYVRSLIDPFVFRLYLANVLAERYTYLKDGEEVITIPLMDLSTSHPLSLRELLKTLGSLSYNLITNGGQTFLGTKDDEKLRALTEKIKSELLRAEDDAA